MVRGARGARAYRPRFRPTPGPGGACYEGGPLMSKRGRKRKDRRKNAANHGKRPNA